MSKWHTVKFSVKISRWRTVWLLWLTAFVSANAADEVWLRLTSPDFTVVTSLREKDAVAWAGDFAQYVAALRDYFRLGQKPLPPLTMVLFTRERDFEKYRPLDEKGKSKPVAGFFQRHESWAVAGLTGGGINSEVRRTIFHEGVHWFLSTQERPNPVCLEEGLAEVFSTYSVTKNQAEWGRAIDDHVRLLNRADPLPLEQLLFTARSELFGADSMHTSIVYAESWAFVHYAIFGDQKLPRRALSDYADFMHEGQAPDAAFRRAFGQTYREMDHELADYLRAGDYFIARRPLAKVETFKTVVSAPVETADALGRLALAGGRWQLAATHARAAIAAAPDDPRGHEILGLALKELGDTSGSLAEFTRAVECDSQDFQPYFEVASSAQKAAVGQGNDLTMSPQEARRIANRYERAINLHPRFLASYQNLSGVIGLAEPFGPADRQFLEQGQRLYPSEAMVKVGLAVLTHREGDRAAARAQLNQVLENNSGSNSARTYAVRLDAAWEQQEKFEQISQLTNAKKYVEAVAMIDDWMAHGAPVGARAQLTTMRRQLQAVALSHQIQQALEQKRWADARRFLGEVIESDATPQMKLQARRSLDDLDRRHPGLEKAKKE